VEVRGHIELRTNFIDGTASRIVNIRYLVVNAPSAYNILLGRPALNRTRAVASTRHMKMKLPSLEGAVITIKSDQKAAKKCYENSMETKRGVCTVTNQPPEGEGVTRVETPEKIDLSPQRMCWKGRLGERSSSLADPYVKRHKTRLSR